MRFSKAFVVLLLLFVWSFELLYSQDLSSNQKVWYSSYFYLKLGKKSYLEDFVINGNEVQSHSFSFLQNEIAFNYRITNNFTIFIGGADYHYKWTPSFAGKYDDKNGELNLLTFIRGSFGLKYKFNFLKFFELDQNIAFHTYFPTFEKYQSRILYSAKIEINNRKKSLVLIPFFQASFYYYLNGIPQLYFNEDNTFKGYFSPNGLHRARYKIGVKFKPFKKHPGIGVLCYYSMQKEFNLSFLGGHDLNISRNVPMNYQENKIDAFNNYNIYGVQLNFILKKNKKR
ncbi:MAG: hypothetical protein HYR91_13785 [Flavobacteriia bacterium]|nr:hypothetical protein [Flavobacteriia bacterium]